MRLSESITEYLVRRRSGGLSYSKAESSFMAFLKQVGDIELCEVTTSHILRFLDGPLTSTVTWRSKHALLRRFFEFWTARGNMSLLAIPTLRPRVRPEFVPYVYSRDQILKLVRATESSQASSNCTIDAGTLRTFILLVYGTGARISELLDMVRSDVDVRSGFILLRRNKFSQTRRIPIGKDLRGLIMKHMKQFPVGSRKDRKLFVGKGDKALTQNMITHNFSRLRSVAKVTRNDQTTWHPRLQDLRHTFAVHRITQWIRDQADLNRALPALAAYMGQSGLGSTERYLLLTPERFQKELDKLSPAQGRRWRSDQGLMAFLSTL